jgi:hypothetical protein
MKTYLKKAILLSMQETLICAFNTAFKVEWPKALEGAM